LLEIRPSGERPSSLQPVPFLSRLVIVTIRVPEGGTAQRDA